MIRYKIKSNLSRNINHNHFYMLTAKNTFYGIHKPVPQSKTSLLAFVENEHVRFFKKYIEVHNSQKISFNRNISLTTDDFLYSESIPLTYFSPPLIIQKIRASEIELICILNFFDMLIITKVEKLEHGLTVYGYEHIIEEPPNRRLIEYQLRNLI